MLVDIATAYCVTVKRILPYKIQERKLIKLITARIQLEEKTLVVGLKGLDAKTNSLPVNRQS
jgi:hypothetical protein